MFLFHRQSPTPSDTKNDESLTSPNDEPFSPDHTDCAPGLLGGGAGNQRLLLPVQDTSRTLRPLRSGAHLLLGIPTVQRGLGHQTVQMVSRWTQLLLKGRDGEIFDAFYLSGMAVPNGQFLNRTDLIGAKIPAGPAWWI